VVVDAVSNVHDSDVAYAIYASEKLRSGAHSRLSEWTVGNRAALASAHWKFYPSLVNDSIAMDVAD
jgi:hypothetical protein